MNEKLYPKPEKDRSHLDRPWILSCHLAYDGGGADWAKGYRTYIGARIAAWWHYHVASWGGRIDLIDNRNGNYVPEWVAGKTQP